jgi:hypothetical protein
MGPWNLQRAVHCLRLGAQKEKKKKIIIIVSLNLLRKH